MIEYYEINDGWFTYYANVATGEKKFELEDGDILVERELDDQMRYINEKVSEGLPPENELRNGMVLAWSKQLDEWQVENWGYVKDRPDDYTHWKPLPEPPKGE